MLQHLGHPIALRVRRNELNEHHHQIGIVLDLTRRPQLHDDARTHRQEVRYHRQVAQQPVRVLLRVHQPGLHVLVAIGEHSQQQPQPDDRHLSALLAGRRQASHEVLEHLNGGLRLPQIVHQQLLQVGQQLDVALLLRAGAQRRRIRQQELAETLHGQMVEVAIAVLHQIGEPRHRLRRALALDDVQQQVGTATAAQQVAEFVRGVQLLALVQLVLLDATRSAVRIHQHHLGQQQRRLLVDDDLGGGRRQVHLKLEDLGALEGEQLQ